MKRAPGRVRNQETVLAFAHLAKFSRVSDEEAIIRRRRQNDGIERPLFLQDPIEFGGANGFAHAACLVIGLVEPDDVLDVSKGEATCNAQMAAAVDKHPDVRALDGAQRHSYRKVHLAGTMQGQDAAACAIGVRYTLRKRVDRPAPATQHVVDFAVGHGIVQRSQDLRHRAHHRFGLRFALRPRRRRPNHVDGGEGIGESLSLVADIGDGGILVHGRLTFVSHVERERRSGCRSAASRGRERRFLRPGGWRCARRQWLSSASSRAPIWWSAARPDVGVAASIGTFRASSRPDHKQLTGSWKTGVSQAGGVAMLDISAFNLKC